MTYSFFDLQEKTEDMYIVKHLVHLGILKMLFVVEWNDFSLAGILVKYIYLSNINMYNK